MSDYAIKTGEKEIDVLNFMDSHLSSVLSVYAKRTDNSIS